MSYSFNPDSLLMVLHGESAYELGLRDPEEVARYYFKVMRGTASDYYFCEGYLRRCKQDGIPYGNYQAATAILGYSGDKEAFRRLMRETERDPNLAPLRIWYPQPREGRPDILPVNFTKLIRGLELEYAGQDYFAYLCDEYGEVETVVPYKVTRSSLSPSQAAADAADHFKQTEGDRDSHHTLITQSRNRGGHWRLKLLDGRWREVSPTVVS